MFERHPILEEIRRRKRRWPYLTGGMSGLSGMSGIVNSMIAFDAFTGSNGTAITSHAANYGGAWTVFEGTYQIQGNKAQCVTATGGFPTAVMDVGQSDVTIDDTISIAVTGARHGIRARYSDNGSTESGWRIVISNTDNTVKIFEVVDDVQTLRATVSLTINLNTDYALRVVARGTTISATVNGANPISYGSASTNQASTKHGLDDGDVAMATHDNFKVTYP